MALTVVGEALFGLGFIIMGLDEYLGVVDGVDISINANEDLGTLGSWQVYIYIDYRELELLLQEECSYFRVFSPLSCLVTICDQEGEKRPETENFPRFPKYFQRIADPKFSFHQLDVQATDRIHWHIL